MTKRKKTVFSNSQLAHVWAQQTQETGRNSSGSMFFENDVIYSYGRHYAIAKIHGNVVLVNEWNYSSTTNMHRIKVINAVSHIDYFFVPDVINIDSQENKNYFTNKVNS